MSDTRGPRRVVRFENGRPMLSQIPFDYIDPDLPSLKLLRQQEGLDRLAAEASSEFDLIVRVLQHVKEQWDHSYHAPMQHVNALEVLEDVRSGLRGNFCVYFTHVLLQSLWSLGITCRYLHVAVHHWQSHSTSECWSNEHRKWIVADSDFNLHYVKPELATPGMGPVRALVPQSALDIQRAYRSGSIAEILPVQGPWAAAMSYSIRLGDYYGGCVGFLADYLDALSGGPPEWHGQSCQWYVWQAKDEPLAAYHRHHFQLTHGNGVCHWVSDQEQYYWPINEVVIEPLHSSAVGGDSVELRFQTFAPFLETFLVRLDGGPWQETRPERIDGHRGHGQIRWALSGGRNVLEIRCRNRAGRLGPISLVEVATPPYVPPEPINHSPVEVGAGMGGIDARGGRLYVPRQLPGAVLVVRDGRVERTFGTPIALDLNPQGPPAEVWSEPRNLERAACTLPGHLLAPQACAVGDDGTIHVADAENYRIQPFRPNGEPLEPWGHHGIDDLGFLHIRALAVAPDGSVLVADSGYAGPVGMRTEHISRLRRFSPHGELLGTLATSGDRPGQILSPAGLAVDQSGQVWVVDSGNHRVQFFSQAGQLLRCWGKPGDGWGELRYPTDVAVAQDGSMFVADPHHRCVWKFRADGEPLARVDRGGDHKLFLRPGRLAIEADRLFIGDVGSGLIHEFQVGQ